MVSFVGTSLRQLHGHLVSISVANLLDSGQSAFINKMEVLCIERLEQKSCHLIVKSLKFMTSMQSYPIPLTLAYDVAVKVLKEFWMVCKFYFSLKLYIQPYQKLRLFMSGCRLGSRAQIHAVKECLLVLKFLLFFFTFCSFVM